MAAGGGELGGGSLGSKSPVDASISVSSGCSADDALGSLADPDTQPKAVTALTQHMHSRRFIADILSLEAPVPARIRTRAGRHMHRACRYRFTPATRDCLAKALSWRLAAATRVPSRVAHVRPDLPRWGAQPQLKRA
jgi:hypothetical protein